MTDLETFVERETKIFKRMNPNLSERCLQDYLNRVKVVSGLDFDLIASLWRSSTSFFMFWDSVQVRLPI